MTTSNRSGPHPTAGQNGDGNGSGAPVSAEWLARLGTSMFRAAGLPDSVATSAHVTAPPSARLPQSTAPMPPTLQPPVVTTPMRPTLLPHLPIDVPIPTSPDSPHQVPEPA